MYSLSNLEPVHCSMSGSKRSSWPAYRFHRRQISLVFPSLEKFSTVCCDPHSQCGWGLKWQILFNMPVSLSLWIPSVQFSSVAQSCPTLCDPMNCSMPGLPVHHQLPEFTQTHVHRVGDAIHPSHPLSSPSPPVPNPSQHQSLFQWVNSSHEVAKVLEFQL